MDACATSEPRVDRGDLAMLPQMEVTTLTAVAHALSDPVRLQILWLLEQREELCTCEFEEVLALGQSRVSYHLKLLLDAGLLVRRRRGTWNHYRLARRGLLACVRWLPASTLRTRGRQRRRPTMAATPSIPSLASAIAAVHEDLDQVRHVKKCTSCECLLDVLEAIRADLANVDAAEAERARADFGAWWEAGNAKRHRCPGCEPCLPIAPYNQLNTLLASVGMTTTEAEGCAGGSCGCGGDSCVTTSEQVHEEEEGVTTQAGEPPKRWPIVEGNYVVGDPAAPIAICTLADDDLLRELTAAEVTSRVAITGTLTTENLGVEHVLQNLAANPRIQTLVLCGRDSRGHRAGQALLSLKQGGIDGQRRIVGALGSRAVLKNLADAEIAAFRERITLVDEIGTQDVERIASLAEAYLLQDTPHGTPAAPVLVSTVLPPKRSTPKVVEARAQERREWVHDPEGFFVILLDRGAGAIVCEHYTKDGVHDETIRGAHAADIANTAVRRGLLSRLDHAAYLGRELAKAESALTLSLAYTQDAPLITQ